MPYSHVASWVVHCLWMYICSMNWEIFFNYLVVNHDIWMIVSAVVCWPDWFWDRKCMCHFFKALPQKVEQCTLEKGCSLTLDVAKLLCSPMVHNKTDHLSRLSTCRFIARTASGYHSVPWLVPNYHSTLKRNAEREHLQLHLCVNCIKWWDHCIEVPWLS